MLKEIFEQPQSLDRFFASIFKYSVDKEIGRGHFKRLVITACGTSFYAGLIGKYLIEKNCRIPVEVDIASEFQYREPLLKKDDLVLVISQSGETADTIGALRLAKNKGVKTLGIVNVENSTIAREVDSVIYLRIGPEVGVASTKAFTAQVAALCWLALSLRQGFKKQLSELKAISLVVREALKLNSEIKKLARVFAGAKNFLFLGRGVNFPVALEGALKLKEVSYIHAEGCSAGEMKHGPIALIDQEMPVVFLATGADTYQKVLSNMEEVRCRGGKIIALAEKGDRKVKKLADYLIELPRVREIFSPIVNVVPLQLLAYHIANLKGLNVDKPRNLAKSVTVE